MKIEISRRQILYMVEVLERLVKPEGKFQEGKDGERGRVDVLCVCCGEPRDRHRMSCDLVTIYERWVEVEVASRKLGAVV